MTIINYLLENKRDKYLKLTLKKGFVMKNKKQLFSLLLLASCSLVQQTVFAAAASANPPGGPVINEIPLNVLEDAVKIIINFEQEGLYDVLSAAIENNSAHNPTLARNFTAIVNKHPNSAWFLSGHGEPSHPKPFTDKETPTLLALLKWAVEQDYPNLSSKLSFFIDPQYRITKELASEMGSKKIMSFIATQEAIKAIELQIAPLAAELKRLKSQLPATD